MTIIGNTIGRVMMAAVRFSRSNENHTKDIRTWAYTEYKRDPEYAYQCLLHGKKVDLR